VYEATDLALWCGAYEIKYLETIAKNYNAVIIVDKETQKALASGFIKLDDTKSYAYIGMVFTDPDVRHMGLGSTIIKKLEEEDIVKSVNRIELSSSLSAVRFYEKYGYKLKEGIYEMECVATDDTFTFYCVPMEKYI